VSEAAIGRASSPMTNEEISTGRVRSPRVPCIYRYGTFPKETTMAKKLNGKVAGVNGGAKGIGAGVARELAAEGGAGVGNNSSSKEGADRVVASITAAGGKAVAVRANVANPADIRRLFAQTRELFGRLDVLVNNAGIYEFKPLTEVTPEHFHKQFDL